MVGESAAARRAAGSVRPPTVDGASFFLILQNLYYELFLFFDRKVFCFGYKSFSSNIFSKLSILNFLINFFSFLPKYFLGNCLRKNFYQKR